MELNSFSSNIHVFLEIINAMCVIFVLTEVTLTESNYYLLFVKAVCPTIFVNILIRRFNLLQNCLFCIVDILYPINKYTRILLPLLLMCSIAIYIKSKFRNSKLMKYRIFFYLTVIMIISVVVYLFGFGDHIHRSIHIKILTITLLFSLLLFFDVKRQTEDVSLRVFCTAVAKACAYCLFAIPVAAVVISCVFLVVTALAEKVGMDPEHSLWYGDMIFAGVIYGPFYLIYWRAKRYLLQWGGTLALRPLPCHVTSPPLSLSQRYSWLIT